MKCTEYILNIAVILISFSRQKRTKETPDNLNIYMFRYTLFPLVTRAAYFSLDCIELLSTLLSKMSNN